MSAGQGLFLFGPVRNRSLFSSHWLENRLQHEPEWQELRGEATTALEKLAALWESERTLVALYDNEQSLEHAFIQPVFKAIGWDLIYQTYLPGGKPDYALFLSEEDRRASLTAGKKTSVFWEHAEVVADAKSWDRSLDHPTVIDGKKEYPPQQIERYLDRSHKNYSILTNGKLWRLIPRVLANHQHRFQTYLECDLSHILDEWLLRSPSEPFHTGILDDFLRFYLFFSPQGHRVRAGRKPLLQRAAEGSTEYSVGVGEGLKEGTFEALRLCIEGLLTFAANGMTPRKELALCREHSFILLYRLLFILLAEDRGLLPYRSNMPRLLPIARVEVVVRPDPGVDGVGDAVVLDLDILSLVRETADRPIEVRDRGERQRGNGHHTHQERQPHLVQRASCPGHPSRDTRARSTNFIPA